MSVIKNSIIYLASSVISKAAPFALLPFLTLYLDKKSFGTLSVYLVFITLYSAVIGMALHTNIAKNFFKISKKELATIIWNMQIVLFGVAVVIFLVTYYLSLEFDEVFSIPTQYLLVLPLFSFLMMTKEFFLAVLRSEGKAYLFGFAEILSAFVMLVVTVTLLKNGGIGWLSQVVGMFASVILISLGGVIYLYRNHYFHPEFDLKIVKSVLEVSLPLIPHVLGVVVISVSDRLFIERMVGLDMVALYAIGYSFGMVVSILSDAVIKAWTPWFYKRLVAPSYKDKKNIVTFTYAYIISIFIGALLISIVGELILPYVVDEDYYAASEFIVWIAMGYAIHGVYKIFFPYLVHINKTKFLAFSTVLAALLNMLFNYVLIGKYGAIGAAYATIISFSVSATLVFWYQKKSFPMPWSLRGKV